MIENKEEFYKLLYRLRGLNNEAKLSRHLQSKLEAFEEMKGLVRLTIPVVSISKAEEYTKFIIIADRKGLPLISLDDYIKHY